MNGNKLSPEDLIAFKKKIEETIKSLVPFYKVIHVDAIDLKRWSVVLETELGAYKMAYAYRHGTVHVDPAPNVGGWLITIGY